MERTMMSAGFESSRKRPETISMAIRSLVGVLAVSCCSGCCLPEMIRATFEPYENLKTHERLTVRAGRQARLAWNSRYESCYTNHRCGDDVKKGFIAAYIDAAMGFNGCPPPFPTTPLLSVSTVTHTKPAAIPWYEGYDLGYASAVSEGVDQWRLTPVNPNLAANACQSAPRFWPAPSHTASVGDTSRGPAVEQEYTDHNLVIPTEAAEQVPLPTEPPPAERLPAESLPALLNADVEFQDTL
jgi:hypothetical protein